MLDFRTPTLADKERIDAFVSLSGQIGCDVSFANTYLWRKHYDIRVAFTEDTYFKCYFTDGVLTGYVFPMTRGDIRKALDMIIDDARERGVPPVIGLLNDHNAAVICRLYGDRVRIKEERDAFDYLYLRSDLAGLSGKKYHAKRNHISRFYRTYDDFSFQEICKDNFDDVLDICRRWTEDDDDSGELDAIRDALEHFDELGLFGIVLYIDDRAVAMNIGSRINDSVCDVHFEKAVDVDEAYAVINNEFAKRFDSFTYLNREEDLGLEGLRKSKLSYHPAKLVRKSTAYFDTYHHISSEG